MVPIVNRVVPIVGDDYADMEKGTGVVKITPAHDPNDFEVGNRHNLERIVVMDETAHMNEEAGKYKGYDRFECREALVKELQDKDLLIKIEDITHSVGYSERTDAMVEPYLSEQWFVKMDGLSKNLIEMQGDKDKKVNFYPKRFEKTIIQKAEECYDWCISRQLWWGIRIPVWYKDNEMKASVTSPGEGWVQDPDVLDTWFSSGLWPYSTLGWAMEDKTLFNRYFPTSFMSTGYDIIFFWVFRMMFQAEAFTGKNPFKDCYMHGLIRAKDGRKMSKSLGNGILPIEMVDKYGADTLRYYLTTSSAPGLDLRFDEDKMTSTWNFINKIWNASRFTLMNIEDIKEINLNNLSKEDKWIISKLQKTIKNVRKYMDKYEFQNVGTILYDFIWSDFCDSYIEFSKFNMDKESTKSTLLYVLTNILKMLHPFMPFVTEEIYQKLPIKDSESIMISSYPKYDKKLIFDEEQEVEELINFIKIFRNTKQGNNISSDFKVKFDKEIDPIAIKLLKLEDKIINEELDIKSYKVISNYANGEIYFEKELTPEEKQAKENLINSLKSSIERREKLLSNENYVNKAPANIVEMDKQKLEEEKNKLKELLG